MHDVGVLSLPMTVRFYVEWLRSWAQRVRRERDPLHIRIRINGTVRLETWCAGFNPAQLLEAIVKVWNATPDVAALAEARVEDGVLVFSGTNRRALGIAAEMVPPAPMRWRHILAWLVSRVLPTPSGWTVTTTDPEVKP